jgi:predicted nucleic-acid-binding protein
VVAVDTNVLVRLLTGDEPKQTAQARAIFEREVVLLAKTVILESEWVLRRLYRFGSNRIADAFVALIGLPDLVCEDAGAVADAIQWMRQAGQTRGNDRGYHDGPSLSAREAFDPRELTI